MSLARRQVF
jgi:hypothetical protein